MRIPFLLATLTMLLFAEQIHWYKNYSTALAEAKKTQKPLMLFLTQPGCRTCRYMEEEVFPDKKVRAYLSSHYVAAELHIQDTGLPEKYRVEMSPIFTFVDPDSGEVLEQIMGGKKPDYFYDALEEIIVSHPKFRRNGAQPAQ